MRNLSDASIDLTHGSLATSLVMLRGPRTASGGKGPEPCGPDEVNVLATQIAAHDVLEESGTRTKAIGKAVAVQGKGLEALVKAYLGTVAPHVYRKGETAKQKDFLFTHGESKSDTGDESGAGAHGTSALLMKPIRHYLRSHGTVTGSTALTCGPKPTDTNLQLTVLMQNTKKTADDVQAILHGKESGNPPVSVSDGSLDRAISDNLELQQKLDGLARSLRQMREVTVTNIDQVLQRRLSLAQLQTEPADDNDVPGSTSEGAAPPIAWEAMSFGGKADGAGAAVDADEDETSGTSGGGHGDGIQDGALDSQIAKMKPEGVDKVFANRFGHHAAGHQADDGETHGGAGAVPAAASSSSDRERDSSPVTTANHAGAADEKAKAGANSSASAKERSILGVFPEIGNTVGSEVLKTEKKELANIIVEADMKNRGADTRRKAIKAKKAFALFFDEMKDTLKGTGRRTQYEPDTGGGVRDLTLQELAEGIGKARRMLYEKYVKPLGEDLFTQILREDQSLYSKMRAFAQRFYGIQPNSVTDTPQLQTPLESTVGSEAAGANAGQQDNAVGKDASSNTVSPEDEDTASIKKPPMPAQCFTCGEPLLRSAQTAIGSSAYHLLRAKLYAGYVATLDAATGETAFPIKYSFPLDLKKTHCSPALPLLKFGMQSNAMIPLVERAAEANRIVGRELFLAQSELQLSQPDLAAIHRRPVLEPVPKVLSRIFAECYENDGAPKKALR
ncbi:unnamed protein product [Amoebophrya sp. A25]|nr:unnamed protein product [Amoebophrya sp. A25]|eukprot:GSA25T00016524001.1